ncbi:hypothetical protein K470DRAFT_282205 [Piedraia hortae CBS 480.64]|uniref:C2H2-type domain-containing protein n=1 Tax=Piedraia hortae CBS 480.64 TaxID=1314780 RepID=A0A6A7BY81_9PEZI|nr:hypothetical protein K470DRAFT_282205 [Piedraia hortae CBS 480.64]
MATPASSHPFTCNSCHVAFRSSELQRTHMVSDWHRYNLRRRVASLPPLTSEDFADKVLANKASAEATAARASFEQKCEACDKIYYSENSYNNHVGSQKHKILSARLAASNGAETASISKSSFSLGEPLETASVATSTVTAKADGDVDGIIDEMKAVDVSRDGPAPKKEQGSNAEDAAMDRDYVHKADTKLCLFCNYSSPSLDLNVHHMSRHHGFFVPEREYLVDLPGLINHLSETIQVLNTCLYCHKTVHTASGAQTHMRDRGHCMVAYSSMEEQMDIGDFYDFRSTYSDEETENDEPGGVNLAPERPVKTTMVGEDGEEHEVDDDGWESDSSLSTVPTDEITSIPIEHQHKYARLHLHRHHSHIDARPHKDTDGFHSHAHHPRNAVYHDDHGLHLPTGRTAGHRSLRTYYRQNLRNYPTPEERVERRMLVADSGDSDEETVASRGSGSVEQNEGGGQVAASRADGGMGMLGVSEAKKREVRALEKRDQQHQQRAETRYRWGNEKRANHQKHFRDPLLQ